jgi:hypothetical protein
MRLPDDPPIPFSLTRTGRGGGQLEAKIKKIKNKEIAPAGRRTDYISSDGDRSGRGAARAQNLKKNKKKDCACRTTQRLTFL